MVGAPSPRHAGRSAEIIAVTRRSNEAPRSLLSSDVGERSWRSPAFSCPHAMRSLPQVMLTGATMYALAIGSVSQIIAQVVHRHSISRRIERHAELFIRMHKLPQDLAVQVNLS